MKQKPFFLIAFIFCVSTMFSQEKNSIDVFQVLSHADKFPGTSAQIFGAKAAPTNNDVYSFYRQQNEYRQLWIYHSQSKALKQVSTAKVDAADEFDFEETDNLIRDKFMESQIDWCPILIERKQWYVFVGAGNTSNWDIYLGALNEDKYIRLTRNAAVDSEPVWSPDGERVAFVSSRTGKGDIYLIDNIVQIIKLFNLKKGNRENRDKLVLTIEDIITNIPNIEDEVYSSSDVDEVRLIQLTDNENEDLQPNYSPSGRYIAYTSKDYDEDNLNYGISIIDLNKVGSPIRITKASNTESKPAWSSDERILAYYSSSGLEDEKKDLHAVLLNEDFEGVPFERSIAKSIMPEEFTTPLFTYKNTKEYLLYRNYNAVEDSYEVILTEVKNPNYKLPLFVQDTFISGIYTNDNRLIVTRQYGDDFNISFGFSDELNKPNNYAALWKGEISSFNWLYVYAGGGALAAIGIILAILGGDDDDPPVVEPTLGSPPLPTFNSDK